MKFSRLYLNYSQLYIRFNKKIFFNKIFIYFFNLYFLDFSFFVKFHKFLLPPSCTIVAGIHLVNILLRVLGRFSENVFLIINSQRKIMIH